MFASTFIAKMRDLFWILLPCMLERPWKLSQHKNAYHIECDIIRFLKNVPQILADKEVDVPIVLSSWIQALKKLMSIPGPAYLHWVNSVPPYVWKLQVVRTSSKCCWSIYRTSRKRHGTLQVVHNVEQSSPTALWLHTKLLNAFLRKAFSVFWFKYFSLDIFCILIYLSKLFPRIHSTICNHSLRYGLAPDR